MVSLERAGADRRRQVGTVVATREPHIRHFVQPQPEQHHAHVTVRMYYTDAVRAESDFILFE